MEAYEVSDLELLASALEEALEAREAGLVVGPWLAVDAVALERAACQARRADTARLLHTVPMGGAA